MMILVEPNLNSDPDPDIYHLLGSGVKKKSKFIWLCCPLPLNAPEGD
jgi:hypothetical protein